MHPRAQPGEVRVVVGAVADRPDGEHATPGDQDVLLGRLAVPAVLQQTGHRRDRLGVEPGGVDLVNGLLDEHFDGRVRTLASNPYTLEQVVPEADLVIGAVLVPGRRTPRLVPSELVTRMRPGTVLVDIAVDQGGCFEDSRPTTHDDPTFLVDGKVFYCVGNMPGIVPVTSTHALVAATMPYVSAMAGSGWRAAAAADPALARGLTTHDGVLVHDGVAEAHGLPVGDLEAVLRP